MIRAIILLLLIILFLILSLPVVLFEVLLAKKNKSLADRQAFVIIQMVFRGLLKICGVKMYASGQENIPEDEPVLFVGNHRSYFDILVCYVMMKRPTGFVAKKEIQKIPLLPLWMDRISCLFLDRDNIKEGLKTILKAIEYVKSGISIFIYPEGTRGDATSSLDMMEFHEGSLKIAQKAGCKVIPVSIYGSANIFEKHMPYIKPSKVVIHFGEPVDIKTLPEEYKKKPGLYLKESIYTELKRMKNQYTDIED
ncbi:MAG: lysophospholipid acyltransferase family protein [Eubacteriales bacterium]|nr:lysophospholipid acyltransferase family protein [Eubacteriales bacterium]